MEKRLILAVAVSLFILLVFNKFFPTHKTIPQNTVAQQYQEKAVTKDLSESPLTAQKGESGEEEKEKFFEEQIKTVRSEKYELTFTNVGGSLKSLSLGGLDGTKGKENLFKAQNYNLFDISSRVLKDLDRKEYTLEQDRNKIIYAYEEKEWIRIEKIYEILPDKEYLNLTVRITNLADRNLNFSYDIVGPADLGGKDHVAGRSFLEADALVDGKMWKKKAVKGPEEKAGKINWVAIKNRYFVFALKPFFETESFTAYPTNVNMKLVMNNRVMSLNPGEAKTEKYLFYAGILDENKLKAVGYDLDKLVNYGFFGPISKILLIILGFFQSIFRNWGVAIILLTITVNILLFPLTFKSFSSMQKMKNIQPHLQKLREMHKDNPQKLNKETMELYRKYNINPLGGCLPMLLQMPIFIALYQGLIRSISLKGAGFLWIKDLAAPDSLIKLPNALPFIGQDINILPILMIGAMFFQQKLSQANMGGTSPEQQQQQKTMMLMMPLIFGIFFYKMPAGLVLYWLTNTVLMTMEHKFIGKRVS